jgi:hypothetical protein
VYYAAHERTLHGLRTSNNYGGYMDVNVRALRVVQAAISERTETLARKVAARKGGLIGGPSRAKSISAERRREIAQKASKARWAKVSSPGK